jgi:hypothetical protein
MVGGARRRSEGEQAERGGRQKGLHTPDDAAASRFLPGR